MQRIEGNLVDNRAEQLKMDCTRGPGVGGVQGRITPGERFTISGACFGDQRGRVELAENDKLSSPVWNCPTSPWKDDEIVAEVPRVSGMPDHAMALTVVRSDGKRSVARQVSFVASRERIEVPSDMWSPPSPYHWGGETWGEYYFRLAMNRVCTVVDADAVPTVGTIQSVEWLEGLSVYPTYGWTPYEKKTGPGTGTLLVNWEPQGKEMSFELKVWASCPAGFGIHP
jgi:hypothetical protein